MDIKGTLTRGYSSSSVHYDSVAGSMYLHGLHRLLPYVRLSQHPAILDVGCGTGINLLEAARIFGPCRFLCGVDLAPGMVAVARNKAAQAGIAAVILVADAEALPFPDAGFDLVIANSVFHWITDQPAAMSEFSRVLQPGGQLVLSCAAKPGFDEWNAVVRTALQNVLGQAPILPMPSLPTPQEVAVLAAASGFEPVHLNHLVQPVRVFDPAGFVNLMAIVAPHWAADLTPAARRAVFQAIINLIAAKGRGNFVCTWGALELVARRGGPACTATGPGQPAVRARSLPPPPAGVSMPVPII